MFMSLLIFLQSTTSKERLLHLKLRVFYTALGIFWFEKQNDAEQILRLTPRR